jgi:hypothetical protein
MISATFLSIAVNYILIFFLFISIIASGMNNKLSFTIDIAKNIIIFLAIVEKIISITSIIEL